MADHCNCGAEGCPNIARIPQPDPDSTGVNWFCVECKPNCDKHPTTRLGSVHRNPRRWWQWWRWGCQAPCCRTETS